MEDGASCRGLDHPARPARAGSRCNDRAQRHRKVTAFASSPSSASRTCCCTTSASERPCSATVSPPTSTCATPAASSPRRASLTAARCRPGRQHRAHRHRHPRRAEARRQAAAFPAISRPSSATAPRSASSSSICSRRLRSRRRTQYLHAGSVIPQSATSLPVSTQEVLVNLDKLVNSLPKDDAEDDHHGARQRLPRHRAVSSAGCSTRATRSSPRRRTTCRRPST